MSSVAIGKLNAFHFDAHLPKVQLIVETRYYQLRRTAWLLVLTLLTAWLCTGDIQIASAQNTSPTASAEALLGLPESDGPMVVRAAFHLIDIDVINDQSETIEFSGVLTMEWNDPRQAFEPEVAGVPEKVYTGAYQFNELAPAWYPEVTLANSAGLEETRGIVLRVKPDGTSRLTQAIDAIAKVNLNLRLYPFDRQRLELVFEELGFDASEVAFELAPDAATADCSLIPVPQWTLLSVEASTRTMDSPYAAGTGATSALVVSIDVERESWFMLRLVVGPLVMIVVLSWSVFWMDRSSLGDRMSVSFVGILTAVAYQIVVGEILPQISYFTLMSGFLTLSFLVMCATVVVNLVVGAADKNQYHTRGDRIDRVCRWVFPITYFGILLIGGAWALL